MFVSYEASNYDVGSSWLWQGEQNLAKIWFPFTHGHPLKSGSTEWENRAELLEKRLSQAREIGSFSISCETMDDVESCDVQKAFDDFINKPLAIVEASLTIDRSIEFTHEIIMSADDEKTSARYQRQFNRIVTGRMEGWSIIVAGVYGLPRIKDSNRQMRR